jgi:tRNA (mo5U34)-methyltransferase
MVMNAKTSQPIPESIANEATSHFWFHSIDLGNGIVTKGVKTPEEMAIEFENTFSKLDLRGKTVLDIGAWNGGFSVEAYRRGAASVTAMDYWSRPGWEVGRASFEFMARVTGHHFEMIDIDLDTPCLDLSGIGRFDVVLFLGVLYHMIDPIAVLQQVSQLVGETLVVETHIEYLSDERPAMLFYPGAELADDPTNWWGPNRACVTELLKLVGFPRVENIPGVHPNREVFHAYRT